MQIQIEADWDRYWDDQEVGNFVMPEWSSYIGQSLKKMGILNKRMIVLDFGAGVGELLSNYCNEVECVYGLEKSSQQRHFLQNRFLYHKHVKIISNFFELPEKVDVVVVNSVFQYIAPDNIKGIIECFSKHTKKEATIIVSDILPCSYSKGKDFISLCLQTWKLKFLGRFLSHSVRAILRSPQMNVREATVFRYDFEELARVFHFHGFKTEKIRNLGPSIHRYALVAHKP